MVRQFSNFLIIAFVIVCARGMAQTPLYFGWSSVAPGAADYDGDGKCDLVLYNSNKGTIYSRRLGGEELAFEFEAALSGFASAQADYDGDYKADLGFYDRANGVWYAYCSIHGYHLGAYSCAQGASTTLPVPADYDGDRMNDMALYDSASGAWIIYPSLSAYQPVSFVLGGSGAVAVPADYDGDGKADPGVYDETTGLWAALCSASQYAYTWVVYGGPGCAAVPEDFDGDRKADPTVYSAALGVWGTLHSASNYAPNIVVQGGPNCTPVPDHYYFTNRADYAVWNATNGCWYIAYNSVGGFFGNLFCSFFQSLIKGAVSKSGGDSTGWTLNDIFGADPTDPHWAETLQRLSQMNRKLDDLLAGQQVITNMLIQLSERLEYDKNEIEWFVSQSAANNAIAIIESHYDQHGIDGYASFYECDTNNLPTPEDVDYFADIVLGSTYNMKTAVDSIYRAIIPPTGTTNGVLRLWANMARPTLTPDNLLDNFNALAYYFATMYNYQMKGAAMYVDASRVHGTSAWALAATANYITNDLMQMVQSEVDEFRAVTYDYIMTAFNAGYDPSLSNPLDYSLGQFGRNNFTEVLRTMEFFCAQWTTQTQTTWATCITLDRPERLADYNGKIGIAKAGSYSPAYWPRTVVTNHVSGRPYGCWNGTNQNNITVSDRYVILRHDFGPAPAGLGDYYLFWGSPYIQPLRYFSVSNYDDYMTPTTNSALTNYFGHVYASPYNVELMSLPLDASRWQNNTYDAVSYRYANPGHQFIRYQYDTSAAASVTNYRINCTLTYDLRGDYRLPSGMGVWPWIHALGYPFTISNSLGRPVGVNAYVTIDDSYSEVRRWDDGTIEYASPQVWEWQNCGGAAFFTTNTGLGTWGLLPAGSQKYYPNPREWHMDTISTSVVYSTSLAYGVVPSTAANGVLYIGGQIYLTQYCSKHSPGYVIYLIHADCAVQFKVRSIIVTFY